MLSLNGEIEQMSQQSADVEDLERSVEWVKDELQMRCASATSDNLLIIYQKKYQIYIIVPYPYEFHIAILTTAANDRST